MQLGTETSPFQPTQSGERLELLDGLRGLALLGIISANLWSFSGYSLLTSLQMQQLPAYELDRWVYTGLRVLIDSKFSTIFSILFGVGFCLQLSRARSKSTNFTGYFLKRMLLLLAIASVHAYAFWYGDIIRFYAAAGLMMLLVRNWSERTLLLTAVFLMVLATPVVFILNEVFATPAADGLTKGQILMAFSQESYWQVLRMNWRIDDVRNFWQAFPLTIVSTTGKVMLGYWMGRIGLFTNPQTHWRLLRRWFWWGALMGIPSSAVFWAIHQGAISLTPSLAWLPFVVALGMLLQSLCYISAFVQAFQRPRSRRLLQIFVPVGRMALTNYLTQTLVGLLLFYGYLPGPHLMGKVGPANLLLLGITIYALQLGFSRWWLRMHEQGPVEWLWRRLSYGKRPEPSRLSR